MMTYNEFRKLAAKANVVPVFARIPADLDTPVSAYIKLAGRHKDTFLLESIEGGEKLARYSFVGCDPFLTVEATGRQVTLCQGSATRQLDTDPLEFMKELFSFYRPVRVEGLPRFTGGAVGYFAYDTVRHVENVPDDNPDSIGLPDMRFGLYRHLVVFDHLRQEILVIANVLHEIGQRGLKKKYNEARTYIDQTIAQLRKPVRLPRETEPGRSRLVPHSTQKEFSRIVQKARRYIREGDIFQVVLSQRWHVDSKRSALSVYRRLRRINPSPYMFLIRHGEQAVIGASPEMMVRVENGQIETRPIAGTRPRGRNDEEDDRRIKSLLADPKELAEHTMLLDLGRNDIGRVARTGSVKIQDQMIVEKYSHVIHLVSSVSGAISRRTSPIDGHFACFPAGTVSGAPKIRAMEIIDELENERRGVYAGSIAYIDFWANLDSCIAIRTIVKDGRRYYVQAGAGIVADSKPAREFKETEAKARALVEAVTGKD
jgi:anthranilate synthase component 1